MADRAPPADGWAGVTDRFLSAVVHSLTSNNEALAGVAARVVTLNAKADTISTKVDALPTRAQFDTLSTKVDQLTTKVNQLTAAVQGLAAASAAQIAAFGPATTIQAYNDKTRHKNRLRNEKHLPLLPLMDQHGALVIIRTPGALRTTAARLDSWWNRFGLDGGPGAPANGPEYEQLSRLEKREIKQS